MILQTKHEITSIHLNDELHCLKLASALIISLSLPLSFFIYLNLSLYPPPHWSKWRLLVECRYWLPRSDFFSSTNIQGCQCGWGPIDWDLGIKKSWELEAEKNRCKWRAINYMWQESNSVSLLHQSPLQHLMSLIWDTLLREEAVTLFQEHIYTRWLHIFTFV